MVDMDLDVRNARTVVYIDELSKDQIEAILFACQKVLKSVHSSSEIAALINCSIQDGEQIYEQIDLLKKLR